MMAASTSRSGFWVYIGHQKSRDQGHLKVISRKSLKKCCMVVKNLYNKLRSQLQRFMRLNVSAVRCPSGWRSTPGKRVYGHPVSGVRIPLSPPLRKQHQAAFFVSAPRKILTKPLKAPSFSSDFSIKSAYLSDLYLCRCYLLAHNHDRFFSSRCLFSCAHLSDSNC